MALKLNFQCHRNIASRKSLTATWPWPRSIALNLQYADNGDISLFSGGITPTKKRFVFINRVLFLLSLHSLENQLVLDNEKHESDNKGCKGRSDFVIFILL